MNSTTFTGHKNAANMTPQQKPCTQKNIIRIKVSVLQVIC